MVDAYDKRDINGARTIMKKLFFAMASLESGKFVQKVKYGCELGGIRCGPTRMPLMPLTDEEKTDFRKAFEVATA